MPYTRHRESAPGGVVLTIIGLSMKKINWFHGMDNNFNNDFADVLTHPCPTLSSGLAKPRRSYSRDE